ncbi:hypothetical protein ZIOFF_059243 [Zingiber officinale]|uniref:Uncharacterized protein n=1 Tax=Zingiber officinale TaxID=94328 RepID=A0A8J5KB88_ZINOF|nr:hypothetical protein ZIOFF_059243 [Zingiber officinale]
MKLVRPSSLFAKELESSSSLSASGYGSVAKVYVVCEKDEALQANFQRWMIENYPVNEVRVIEEADHMPMLSTPAKLSQYISEIADKNASFDEKACRRGPPARGCPPKLLRSSQGAGRERKQELGRSGQGFEPSTSKETDCYSKNDSTDRAMVDEARSCADNHAHNNDHDKKQLGQRSQSGNTRNPVIVTTAYQIVEMCRLTVRLSRWERGATMAFGIVARGQRGASGGSPCLR